MPPKHVGEELREIVKKVRDGSFEYKSRDKSEINWAKYDYAQIKEMADYLNNIRDIVKWDDYILWESYVIAEIRKISGF